MLQLLWEQNKELIGVLTDLYVREFKHGDLECIEAKEIIIFKEAKTSQRSESTKLDYENTEPDIGYSSANSFNMLKDDDEVNYCNVCTAGCSCERRLGIKDSSGATWVGDDGDVISIIIIN